MKKKVYSIFYVRGKGLDEGFEVVVEKFRNSLCRMAIARYSMIGRSGMPFFAKSRKKVEATSLGVGIELVRYLNVSSSIK